MDYTFYIAAATLFLSSWLLFYEAYRYSKSNGVIAESKLVAWATIGLSGLSIFLSHADNYSYLFLFSIMIGIIFIIKFVRFYFIGQTYSIYEITEANLFTMIREELERMAVVFTEKETLNSDEYYFLLLEMRAAIKVEWYSDRAGEKTITVIFKKWWRTDQRQDLKLQLLDRFRTGREKTGAKKNIIINVAVGFGLLCVFFWFVLKAGEVF